MSDEERAGRRRSKSGDPKPKRHRLRALAVFVRSIAGLRTMCLILMLLGVASTAVLLARPVRASFADDFLLRYGGLGASQVQIPQADCGSALDTLGRDADASSLGALARDAACRNEASRRLAVALAGGALIVVAATMGLVLSARGSQLPHPET